MKFSILNISKTYTPAFKHTLHGEHRINCARFSFTHSYNNVVIGKHLNEYFSYHSPPSSTETWQKKINKYTIFLLLSFHRDKDVSMERIFHIFSALPSSVGSVTLLEIIRRPKCFYQKP